MMIRRYNGISPVFASSARLAENVTVIGNVSLGGFVSVWYGAVLRGDVAPIRIGDGANIQDNCVLHCARGKALTLGKNVTVGHGAILHSCTVEDGCLVGMGATLLDGCVIGEGSVVGAGALVPPGRVIPPHSLVVGVPGRVVRALTGEEAAANLANAEHYVQLGHEMLVCPEEPL